MQIEKSEDGVLGIQTRGRRMVGADEIMELWRPPNGGNYYCTVLQVSIQLIHCVQLTTYFLFWSIPVLFNWSPAIQ